MKTMDNTVDNLKEKSIIDEININILFSTNPTKVIEIINEQINKKNPFVKLYLLILLNQSNLDKEISVKVNETVLNYLSNFPKDTELLYDYLLFLFRNNFEATLKREELNSYLEIVFKEEENYDKLFDLIKYFIKSNSSNIIFEKLVDLFLEKLTKINGDIYYIKKLANFLEDNSKLDELEYLLSKAIKYYKVVWIVDKYSVLLNKKDKIEKIVEILANLLIQNEFNVIWAEALGIIDKAITKADSLSKIISKIIEILPSIKLLIEDKKNLSLIFKIYSKIFENLDNIDLKDRSALIKDYVIILELAKSKNLLDVYELSKNIITNLNKFSNIEISYTLIKKVLSFLNNEEQKVLLNNCILNSKTPDLLANIIINNYKILDLSIIKDKVLYIFENLLNKNNLIQYRELIYYFLNNLFNDILLDKNLSILVIKFLIFYNDFETIKKIAKEIVILNKYSLMDLNDLEVLFFVNLVVGNYVYIFSNITNFVIKYPEKIKFVFEFLEEKLKNNPNLIHLFNLLVSFILTNFRDKEIEVNTDFVFYEYIKKIPYVE